VIYVRFPEWPKHGSDPDKWVISPASAGNYQIFDPKLDLVIAVGTFDECRDYKYFAHMRPSLEDLAKAILAENESDISSFVGDCREVGTYHQSRLPDLH